MWPVVCLVGVGELARSARGCSRAGLSAFTLELTCQNEGCVAEAAAANLSGPRPLPVSGFVYEGRLRGHSENLPAPAKPEFCRPGSEHEQHL